MKQLDAAALGTALGPVARTLTKRMLMSYAAAMDATEDAYLDDLQGIVALPSFVVCPEWQIMNGTPYRTALAADDAAMWACIHVQQDSRFFAPLAPSQRIETRGVIEEMRATRIGVYAATRLTTIDADSGATLAESWFSGIFLERTMNGDGGVLTPMPKLQRLAISTDAVARPLMTVTRALPHLYTEAASIWNPIHTERSAAKDSGLDDILLHGTYAWGRAGLQVIREHAGGDPTRLSRLAGRMAGKALVGDVLSIRSEVLEASALQSTVAFEVIDQEGAVIIADGIAELTR